MDKNSTKADFEWCEMTHHIGLFVPATKLIGVKGIVIPACNGWIISSRNFSPEDYGKHLNETQLATSGSMNTSGLKGYNQYLVLVIQ